jgi:uncharacterized protein YecE (DUF72 family)
MSRLVIVAMAIGNAYVGTTGFSHPDWMGNLYPQFCPSADFLRCYSMTFSSVELDSTSYRTPTAETLDKWMKATPGNFRFAAWFPRTVTHEGDVRSRVENAGSFLKIMSGLGDRLGPLLMQFPVSFGPDCHSVLEELLQQIPEEMKVAVEFRRRDWLVPATFDLLKRNSVALCLTECPGLPRIDVRTADFVYLRFAGDCDQISEDFSHVRLDRAEELNHWVGVAEKFAREETDVYAFFDNHFSGHAPSTAVQFRELLNSRHRGHY